MKSRVAIQGELGSFSHEAALKVVPKCKVLPCTVSAEVFQALATGKAGSAVIPIENSLAGSVAEHYDLLFSNDVHIEAEYFLRIRHTLITLPGAALKDVRRVFSHPVALDQCRIFFRSHPGIQSVPFYDTAGSVKHVVGEKLRDAAAIASAQAADEYSGRILARNLEDDKQNWTRFLLIRSGAATFPRSDSAETRGIWKLSLAFSLANTPGALFKSLSVFALRDLNLTKIESRPVRGKPWQYVFYADVLAANHDRAWRAIEHLREVCGTVKILGKYPATKP